ncbi:zincin-like metallopeptidase domain-containing protein [Sphingobium sp. CR2-8]|uniref:ArdC family protein n=1 Tax=Sphingobium sp. CR2-8 TaxID=1306534 RepID=UPI002DBBF2B6|nr:zincin-like metallopeptidase domain-containing protein [Sphingobium sp. CR2-8]MEC3910587.1 zincin-like metallopeptidase domain-containing protein [Sphingobium sp. CR2-8]
MASNGGAPIAAKARAESETARTNLYDEVTARIIAELEAGRLPWVQPWGRPDGDGIAVSPGLPRNALTARRYSGVNILILWGAVIKQGYPSQGWLTFKQALEAGGCVRKGERGTTVVYADRFTPEAEKVRAVETGSDAKSIPFLKRFTVFNVTQCEGLRPGLAPDPAPLPERQIVPVAEEVIAASGIEFRVGGNRAYYVPAQDYVQVPPQPAFFEQINYYRTCLHELCHGSGHPSRLNRNLVNSFGSKDYAREELIAEMGAAFLCAALGIVPTGRHADYLGSWLDVLREDNRAIFRAASAASKAADWLLARHAAAQVEAVQAEATQGDTSCDETGERQAPQDERLSA